MVHSVVNIAVGAAHAAGEIMRRHFQQVDAIPVTRKARHDYVSEVDRACEAEIVRHIRRYFPDHAFLCEESGQSGDSDRVWVIDPLDGTTNYLHGLPHFAVSIAQRVNGRTEHGVIFDPMREELFTATRGRGALLNDRRIRVSQRKGLEGALLGTGFPYRDLVGLDAYLGMFRDLIQQSAGIRRPGSAALDLAYVAAGRTDGFWELGLAEWDIAAGSLLVREAGGTVTDISGGDRYLQSGNVIAGGLKVHAALLKVIQPYLTEHLRT